jgi:hypothetical protein
VPLTAALFVVTYASISFATLAIPDTISGKTSWLASRRVESGVFRRRASDAGIGFSIHTTHTTPEGATTVAGTHVLPFGEPYAITLMVVARVAGATPTEVETRRRLLDSLRVKAP